MLCKFCKMQQCTVTGFFLCLHIVSEVGGWLKKWRMQIKLTCTLSPFCTARWFDVLKKTSVGDLTERQEDVASAIKNAERTVDKKHASCGSFVGFTGKARVILTHRPSILPHLGSCSPLMLVWQTTLIDCSRKKLFAFPRCRWSLHPVDWSGGAPD